MTLLRTLHHSHRHVVTGIFTKNPPRISLLRPFGQSLSVRHFVEHLACKEENWDFESDNERFSFDACFGVNSDEVKKDDTRLKVDELPEQWSRTVSSDNSLNQSIDPQITNTMASTSSHSPSTNAQLTGQEGLCENSQGSNPILDMSLRQEHIAWGWSLRKGRWALKRCTGSSHRFTPFATMASTSFSSMQKSFKYDVFLSFRGEETRNTFVGHLYQALKEKGIETYKDDVKIEQGKKINYQLMRSIQESRFFIIVFSKTYASSSWCLDELVK
ncbi:Toll/interleukin-1 receptor domain-containing protein, partial [Tanacetum coccineum]